MSSIGRWRSYRNRSLSPMSGFMQLRHLGGGDAAPIRGSRAARSFPGRDYIAADDERYEEARKVYNAMIDKRPCLVARCADVADVRAAVNFGRENNLLIAV